MKRKIVSMVFAVSICTFLLCSQSVVAADYEVIREPWIDDVSKVEFIDDGFGGQRTIEYYNKPMPFINGKATVYTDQINMPGHWVSYFCNGYYEVDTNGNISELKLDVRNSEFGMNKTYNLEGDYFDDNEIYLDYYFEFPEKYRLKVDKFISEKYYGGFFFSIFDQITGLHDETWAYVNGYAKAKESEGSEYYGMIDKNDNVILPFIYDDIGSVGDDGYVWVCKDGKWGIIKVKIENSISTANNREIILTIGEKEINVFGEVKESDAIPKIVNGRTMLPIRIIAEALGASVEWEGLEQKVLVLKDGMEIVITIDSDVALVNGDVINLESSAFVENDRTYLPLRFISENLGADVNWNAETQTVTITPKLLEVAQ